MAVHQPPKCWMCGCVADSSEHVFKARDLRRIFDRDGYAFGDLPTHFSDRGPVRLPGPNSNRVKYPPIICRRCNNETTSTHDRAYDQLSDHLATTQEGGGTDRIVLSEVFGSSWPHQIHLLKKYFAKSLGCRIVVSDCELPDYFPNPVSGEHMELLSISICRSQPFRSLPGYEEGHFTDGLGKGDLLANYSRSHLENTGRRRVTSAVWWENLGHYQINYWFRRPPSISLGQSLDATRAVYGVPAIDHDAFGVRALMWDLLCSPNYDGLGSDRFTHPLARAVWSEYAAARLSTTDGVEAQLIAEKLEEDVQLVKSATDAAILAYRRNGDLDALIDLTEPSLWALFAQGVRLQGVVDRLGINFGSVAPDVNERLLHSYLGPIYQGIQQVFPKRFSSIATEVPFALDSDITGLLLRYYAALGFVLKSQPDGRCYVDIPFRAGNSTPAMALYNLGLALSQLARSFNRR